METRYIWLSFAFLLASVDLLAQESKREGLDSLVQRVHVASLTDSGTLIHHYLWFVEQYRVTARELSADDLEKLDHAIHHLNDELKKGALISDTLFRAERTIAGTEPHPLFMESLDPDKLKEWNRLAGTGFQDVEQQQEILLSLVSSDLSKMDCFDQFQMELAAYSFIVLSPKQLVDHAKLLFGKEVKQDSAIVKLRYERDQGRFDQTEISRKIRRAMLDEVFGNLKDFQKKKFAVRLGMDPLKINQIFDLSLIHI